MRKIQSINHPSYDWWSLKNKFLDFQEYKYIVESNYKDVIINFFIDFTGKKLEEEDKRKMEQILDG